MPIEFNCPKCRETVRAPDGSAGKRACCPMCHAMITVPAPPTVLASIIRAIVQILKRIVLVISDALTAAYDELRRPLPSGSGPHPPPVLGQYPVQTHPARPGMPCTTVAIGCFVILLVGIGSGSYGTLMALKWWKENSKELVNSSIEPTEDRRTASEEKIPMSSRPDPEEAPLRAIDFRVSLRPCKDDR
jgi:hypothetical protein